MSTIKKTKLILNTEPIIFKLFGRVNIADVARRTDTSYPTVYKYTRQPDTVQQLDADYLAKLLLDGLGLTREAALDLKLSEIFAFHDYEVEVEEGEGEASPAEGEEAGKD
jgi:hypothetical protein